MGKTCFVKTDKSFYKSLKSKTLLIMAFMSFLFSSCPPNTDAIQFTNMEEDDLFYPYSEIPFFDKIDKTDHASINKLKIYLNNGKYRSVLETIAVLSEEENNKPDIISIKAAALIGKDDFAPAMKEFNRLKNRNDTPSQPFSTIANMLLRKKKPFAAMMVCQSGLMRDIKSAKLLYQMGYAYNMLGKTNTALAYFNASKSANDLFPELIQANIEKAIAAAYYNLNDFEKAKNALKNDELKSADSGMYLMINAKYDLSQGDYDKAISLIDKAQKSSRSIEAYLTKAQFLILNSKPEESIQLLNNLELAFTKSNFSDVFLLTKALAFLTDGNPKESLLILEKLKYPEKIQNIHMLKAITYFSMNNKKETIEELKQTFLPYSELAALPDFENHLNSTSMGPDIGLAFFCLDQKFYDQAIRIVKKTAEKYQNSILLNFILAECYLQTENFPLAINELIKINKTFKGSYALQFYLSQAYAKAGMIDDATKIYRSLTHERPDFIMANLVYGKLLSDASRWEEARKVYENGLNFVPDSPHLQISLGWVLTYLNELDSLDRFLQIIEKNKKIEPASFLHLKGWAAFKHNDFSKAEELITKAIEAAPGDPEICFHLGMTMMESGKKDVAINLLQQSLLFERQRDKYQDTIRKTLLQNK